MKNLEIIKQVSLTGIGIKTAGEVVEVRDDIAGTLVRLKIAKVLEVEEVEPYSFDPIKVSESVKPKRKRRTKAEIEADKNKEA